MLTHVWQTITCKESNHNYYTIGTPRTCEEINHNYYTVGHCRKILHMWFTVSTCRHYRTTAITESMNLHFWNTVTMNYLIEKSLDKIPQRWSPLYIQAVWKSGNLLLWRTPPSARPKNIIPLQLWAPVVVWKKSNRHWPATRPRWPYCRDQAVLVQTLFDPVYRAPALKL